MNGFELQCLPGVAEPFEVQNSTLAHPEEWFFEALTWGRSDSGETVNPRTALSHGPLWQGVNIIAGDVGQLPLHILKLTDDRKHKQQDSHPVEWLLAHEPNPFQTPSVWKEMMMAWALLWGNGCSYIVRDGTGRPQMFVPLLPDRTYPREIEGENWIETDFGDGKRVPLPYEDVFHIPGLTTDGFWGLSAVEVAKNVIGSGLALRKHGNRTFKNSANLGGVLQSDQAAPKPETRDEFRREWDKMHSGSENAGRVAFLWAGLKFQPMSMSNHDAQWLEAMDLDREFVAGLLILPPYKLGAMKNQAVRANVEQQALEYVNGTLTRWLNRFKEEIHRKLFAFGERRLMRLYAEWDLSDILRGDMAAIADFGSKMLQAEAISQNEFRMDWLGLDALPGGDTPRNPAINPEKDKQPEPVKPAPADDRGAAARRTARNLIRDQCDALLEKEAATVRRTCGEAGNLVRWAENYYEKFTDLAGDYLSLSCELASHSGLGPLDWRRVACEHARDSLNRLLALTGIATKDALPEIGRQFAESVRERKEQFANAILGE